MTPRDYKRRARQRQFETGESYAHALLQVRSGKLRGHLPENGVPDVHRLSRATGLKPALVEQLLTYLARQGVPGAHYCPACTLWGADAECWRCLEENHAACLDEVAGRQVCRECASIMEGAGL